MAPTPMSRLFPVNRSLPHIMHIESARPKLAPITSFVSPTVYSDPLICAPRVKINVMPIPIYTPANMEYTKHFKKLLFA